LRRKRLYKREKINKYKEGKEKKAQYDKVLSKVIKERKAHQEAAKKGKEEEAKPKEVAKEVKGKQAPVKAAEAKKVAAPVAKAQ